MAEPNIQLFYIQEEQSIYLLSHNDAKKLKDWISLCKQQLEQLGFDHIEFIGKGAYGFVFGGITPEGKEYVFKFSRINLPQKIQDRLEEEAYMLGQVDHPLIPKLIDFQRIKKQSILVMERVKGRNLEEILLLEGKLSPRLVLKIAAQLVEILLSIRSVQQNGLKTPVVHGDIKPSNIVFDPETEKIGLIDWGSSVFAQVDEHDQLVTRNVMDLMSDSLRETNARMGDVYYIGENQLNAGLSSPRFDEQGLAGTLYALASGQSSRFGHPAIPVTSLNLPVELARTLDAMLDDNSERSRKGGDYLLKNMRHMKNIILPGDSSIKTVPMLPVWLHEHPGKMDTVVYTSRKSFFREEDSRNYLAEVDNMELDKYYKNFLQNVGKKEKAFLVAVSRLGKYPVVGGLAVRWVKDGIYVDSNINLYDRELRQSFYISINNTINLARTIHRVGLFKAVYFKARDTLHIERESPNEPFVAKPGIQIPFDVVQVPKPEDESRLHSYFEDGDDPDENLELPPGILSIISELNTFHHTGVIIFESFRTHLKIHSYYVLMNPERKTEFRSLLDQIFQFLPDIHGLGVSGFMKLPYKDTRFFPLL
ncbi:MAG: phosphotransferase [SAR324 cluster bacterium]|nr:phosphotransferase [SAR324 cluster bacterium]